MISLFIACTKNAPTNADAAPDASASRPASASSSASTPASDADADLDAADAQPEELDYEAEDAGPSFYAPGPVGSATTMTHAGAPSTRYAALDQSACEAELKKRAIVFVRGAPTEGVREPVRLHGPLHGISIHSMLAVAQREKSASEIFDCRLVLAVDDFSAILARHDVVEMTHFSAYRSQKNGGCTPKHAGKQHCAGLAVDVATFKKKDGTTLDVKRDFGGQVGIATCGPGAKPIKPSAPQVELWGLACEAASRGIFNVILTPNFNAQHENHVHLEVTTEASWILVH